MAPEQFPEVARDEGQHALRQPLDQVRGFGDGNEDVGRHHGAVAAAPAQQGLDADHRLGVEGDDRLVGEEKLVPVQRDLEQRGHAPLPSHHEQGDEDHAEAGEHADRQQHHRQRARALREEGVGNGRDARGQELVRARQRDHVASVAERRFPARAELLDPARVHAMPCGEDLGVHRIERERNRRLGRGVDRQVLVHHGGVVATLDDEEAQAGCHRQFHVAADHRTVWRHHVDRTQGQAGHVATERGTHEPAVLDAADRLQVLRAQRDALHQRNVGVRTGSRSAGRSQPVEAGPDLHGGGVGAAHDIVRIGQGAVRLEVERLRACFPDRDRDGRRDGENARKHDQSHRRNAMPHAVRDPRRLIGPHSSACAERGPS